MKFDTNQTKKLLNQESITNISPWSLNQETVIDLHIKKSIKVICQKLKIKDKTEYNHYGSGYASFIDCWLYLEKEELRYLDCGFYGLVILFSRLSNYYVIGEGTKTWKGTTGSSYLPSCNFVDQIKRPKLKEIEKEVTTLLTYRGFERLYKKDLEDKLNQSFDIPTMLGDPPFTNFDLLFYWED